MANNPVLTQERIALTMSTEQLERLDNWRRGEPDLPSRAEALRRMVEFACGIKLICADWRALAKQASEELARHNDNKKSWHPKPAEDAS